MIGYNSDVKTQTELLFSILSKNELLYKVINEARDFRLEGYYIGAGCICQTVWNYQNGNDLMYGISDIDFVYYNASDISYNAENQIIETVKRQYSNLPVKIDVKNQARVHLWYRECYGYDINPYNSLESAVNSWPTTATAVGVRMVGNELMVYAPFGLNDMFGQIIRPNKAQITETIYNKKCNRWQSKWQGLTIIPW